METLRIGPGVPRLHARRRITDEALAAAGTLAHGLMAGAVIGIGLTIWAMIGSFF